MNSLIKDVLVFVLAAICVVLVFIGMFVVDYNVKVSKAESATAAKLEAKHKACEAVFGAGAVCQ